MEGDIFSGFSLLYPDILSTDAIGTDEDMGMCTDFCEVECLCDGSISCPDDCDSESLIEIPIARRAIGNTLAIELHLTRDAEFSVLISCGEDDTTSLVGISFLCLHDEVIF